MLKRREWIGSAARRIYDDHKTDCHPSENIQGHKPLTLCIHIFQLIELLILANNVGTYNRFAIGSKKYFPSVFNNLVCRVGINKIESVTQRMIKG